MKSSASTVCLHQTRMSDIICTICRKQPSGKCHTTRVDNVRVVEQVMFSILVVVYLQWGGLRPWFLNGTGQEVIVLRHSGVTALVVYLPKFIQDA